MVKLQMYVTGIIKKSIPASSGDRCKKQQQRYDHFEGFALNIKGILAAPPKATPPGIRG